MYILINISYYEKKPLITLSLVILEIPPPSSIVHSQGVDIFHSKSEKLRNGHQQNSYKKHEEKGKQF